jgi:hypothetical protein
VHDDDNLPLEERRFDSSCLNLRASSEYFVTTASMSCAWLEKGIRFPAAGGLLVNLVQEAAQAK